MAWVYLFIAALFEVGWTFSVKFLSFKKIFALKYSTFFSGTEALIVLLPLIGYILLGIGNIFFFSLAIKKIPTTIALAAWMSVSLVGVKIADTVIFKEPYSYKQVFFIALILVGIIGLKSEA